MVHRYWTYQRAFFPNIEDYFERPFTSDRRPPVFRKQKEWANVIVSPEAGQDEINKLRGLLPETERHKWFRSMNSSQALAQSILGNLAIYGHLGHLTELTDDAGMPLLGEVQVSLENFFMEYKVDYLGEPRRTNLDCFISGKYRVAIECKFTETEVGSCSRPRLTLSNSNYAADFCDGNYMEQMERKEKCSLMSIGVLYWKYVPELLRWRNDIDLKPCPLNKNYQLVRNVLAVCVQRDGSASSESGHVVLIYDERNPAFQMGGDGFIAIKETQQALKEKSLLRKCSWQRIVMHLRKKQILPWLLEQLELKYGL